MPLNLPQNIRLGHGMKRIVLGLTLKLEINKMIYEEKLAFVKEHLGDEMQFSDVDSEVDYFNDGRTLLGLRARSNSVFIDHHGTEWDYCRPIPKKKLIPWTLETAESVQVRHKELGHKVWMNYGAAGAWYHGVNFVSKFTYEQLLGQFETVDGRPCGTEVTE